MERFIVFWSIVVAVLLALGVMVGYGQTPNLFSIAYQYQESAFWAGVLYQNMNQEISLWRQISWSHQNSEEFTGMWALEGSSFIQGDNLFGGQLSVGLRLETQLKWFRSINKFVLQSAWPQIFLCWQKSYKTKSFILTHWIGMAWTWRDDLNWFWPVFRIQFSLLSL